MHQGTWRSSQQAEALLLVQASPGAGMGVESLESCNCTFYMLDFAELAAAAGVGRMTSSRL